MRKLALCILLLSLFWQGFAQVSINTDGSLPNNSAMLDVKSTAKGMLPPRMTTAQRDQISLPALGLMIFNTDCNDLQYFNGAKWVPTGNTGLISQPGSITGSASPCVNATGVSYSIAPVANATSYHWTVPPGATVASGQGTNSVLVNFGNTSGTVCVAGLNDCYRSMVTCYSVSLSPTITASVSISANANTVCPGTQVTFTATPTNGGSAPTYQWKKNSVNISGATNATYTYAPANNDVISCQMTSNALCVSTATVYSNNITMTVLTSQPVSVSIVASANNVCAGTPVIFTATPINGGTSPLYQWIKNGSNIIGATNMTYTYPPANGDQITCQLTSNIPCPIGNPVIPPPLSINVIPVSPVSVSIAASVNPVCQGSSVTLTATPVNGGTSPTYQWKRNGSNVSGATNATFTYVPANNDFLQCIMTSNIACPSGNPAASNTVTITVNAPLAVSVAIAANATLVCAGTQVTFTATPTNGGATPVYQWRKNSANITGATNAAYSYAPANGDVITCRMTSSLNCVTGNPAISTGITMTVIPTQPVSINIMASANPECTGSQVTFTSSITNGGTSPQYQWKKNGTNIGGATASSYTYFPANNDQISCVLTSNVLCGTGTPATSNVITMSVGTPGFAYVSIAVGGTPQCNPGSVPLTAVPENGGANPTYQWFENNDPISGATASSYTLAISGFNNNQYKVEMTSSVQCLSINPVNDFISLNAATVTNCPVCYGEPIQLNCAALTGGCGQQGATYHWENSSGSWSITGTDMADAYPIINAGEVGYNTDIFYLTVQYPSPPESVTKGFTYAVVEQVGSANCIPCNSSFSKTHTQGTVAPVTKTVTYGTVTNIPGEPTKCWITRNLGASQQATAVSDATEASAGWYWQFNRKQGYKHDGTTRTPNTTWITLINEFSDWDTSNDPCILELGSEWRLPTDTEWYNVDNDGGWTNWNGPWGSGLKLHAAGYLNTSDGSMISRGSYGYYWSSMHSVGYYGWLLSFGIGDSSVEYGGNKATGCSVRCLRD